MCSRLHNNSFRFGIALTSCNNVVVFFCEFPVFGASESIVFVNFFSFVFKQGRRWVFLGTCLAVAIFDM